MVDGQSSVRAPAAFRAFQLVTPYVFLSRPSLRIAHKITAQYTKSTNYELWNFDKLWNFDIQENKSLFVCFLLCFEHFENVGFVEMRFCIFVCLYYKLLSCMR